MQSCLEDEHVNDLKLLKAVTELESAGTSSSDSLSKNKDVTSVSRKHSVETTVMEKESVNASQDQTFSNLELSEIPTERLIPMQEMICDKEKKLVLDKNHKPILTSSTDIINSKPFFEQLKNKVSKLENLDSTSKDISSNHFIGFTTASSKPLTCSSNSLQKAKVLLDDVHKNVEPSSNHSIGFTTASSKPLTFSSNSLQKARLLLDDVHKSRELETESNCSNLDETSEVLFKTASNKPLSISSNALKKANAILTTVHDTPSMDLLYNKPSPFDINNLNSSHKGDFMTASRRSVTISASAWKKGQKLISGFKDNESSSSSEVTPQLNVNCPTKRTVSSRRFSLGATSNVSSPLFKSVKAKRRNSLYKPPRKREPLQDSSANITNAKLSCNAMINKRHLGLKQDQESQIFVSDESMLRAMALFEKV